MAAFYGQDQRCYAPSGAGKDTVDASKRTNCCITVQTMDDNRLHVLVQPASPSSTHPTPFVAIVERSAAETTWQLWRASLTRPRTSCRKEIQPRDLRALFRSLHLSDLCAFAPLHLCAICGSAGCIPTSIDSASIRMAAQSRQSSGSAFCRLTVALSPLTLR